MHIKRADYWNVGPFGILGSDEFAIIIEVSQPTKAAHHRAQNSFVLELTCSWFEFQRILRRQLQNVLN